MCKPYPLRIRIKQWFWNTVVNAGSKVWSYIRSHAPYGTEALLKGQTKQLMFISTIMDLEEDGHITQRVSDFIIDQFNETVK